MHARRHAKTVWSCFQGFSTEAKVAALALFVFMAGVLLTPQPARAEEPYSKEETTMEQEVGAVRSQVGQPQVSEGPMLLAELLEPQPAGMADASAQTALAPSASNDDRWEIIIAPYLWLASIDGDMGVGRVTSAPLDVSAGTILENFQFGGMGRFEVRKGRWGGIFEASYVELGASIPSTGAVIGVERVTDAEFEQTMLEAFLSYRAFRSEKTSVDVFGGARYWDMDIDLEVRGPVITESLSRGERWADPVFGARVVHFLSDKWFLPLRADIGGFGANSDFTWNLQGGVGYEITKRASLVVQYKALGVDFDNGKQGTPDFFAYDAIAHGPLIGFVLRF